MNCLECHDILQRRLDGDTIARNDALDRHLADCPACRERYLAARCLLESLHARPRPMPNDVLTSRIVAAVLRDREKRRLRLRRSLYVTAALAASILIMLLFTYFSGPPSGEEKHDGPVAHQPENKQKALPVTPPPVAVPDDKTKQPEKVELPPKDNGNQDKPPTLAALTTRLADKTLVQAKVLWTAANPIEGMPVGELPRVPELDPQVTQDASSSFKAVSQSARRAVNYFSRELPMFELPPSH